MAREKNKARQGSVIPSIFDHYILIFFAAAVAFALVQVYLFSARPAEAFLASFVLLNVGLQGLLAGFAHWHRPLADKVAAKIGWQPGSPFQKEVAAADAAFGVLGVLSYWARGDFLVATAIGSSLMLFIMGVGHALDLSRNRNKSVFNTGSVLYFDLGFPLLLLALLLLWKAGF